MATDAPPTAWNAIPLADRMGWARRHMRRTAAAGAALPPMPDVRLAATVHVDLKSALMMVACVEAGAQVKVHPADAATTRADVVAHLAGLGIPIADVATCVAWRPTHTLEMGGDIAVAAGPGSGIRAGIEVTRTGLTRLAAARIDHPVFDLDGVPLKHDLHNRFAVGTSTWHAFTARTNLSLHGQVVGVIGFGEVGAGLAHAARTLGARVVVAEPDPARATMAAFGGFEVAALPETAARADVLVTATGRDNVVSAAVIGALKDGCILLNAGHSAAEIAVAALGAGTPVLPHVTQHRVEGRAVFLFAGGHIANLAAGDGDSLNAFDVTAALMTAAIGWTVEHGTDHPPGIHPLPDAAWRPAITLDG